MSSAERIVVVRALPGLGDLLCAVPALRAVRTAHPAAHVTLVGLPQAALLRARFPELVDELLPFPGWPGIPEVPLDPPRTAAFLADAQRRRFDLALQLHGSGAASNGFTALLGARRSAGAHVPALGPPVLDVSVPYPEGAPEIERQLAVLAAAGLPRQGTRLAFPLTDADRETAAALAPPAPYAVVHPGASIADRRWPAGRFAAVADALAARGLVVVLTGTAGEAEVTAAVRTAMDAEALDLAGRTSLGALAGLVAGAALTVANDTGTAHLADALGAPSVVVFTGSDPARWASLDRARHRALGPGEVTPRDVLAALPT